MALPRTPRAPASTAHTIALRPWFLKLRAAIKVARVESEPESVHQLRGALARIDVWLKIAAQKKPRSDVRWLRARAAAVRDLDIQLAMDLPERVAAQVRRRRTAARRRLREALVSPRLKALMRALTALEPLAEELVEKGVKSLARRTLKRGRRALKRPDDLDALHALRRSVRRVRYAIEWTGRSTRGMAKLQEALGKAADFHVAALTLRDAPGDSRELRAYRKELDEALRRKARRARRLWRAMRLTFKRLA